MSATPDFYIMGKITCQFVINKNDIEKSEFKFENSLKKSINFKQKLSRRFTRTRICISFSLSSFSKKVENAVLCNTQGLTGSNQHNNDRMIQVEPCTQMNDVAVLLFSFCNG